MKDVFFVVCDGLKGLPDVVADVWPQARVQTCVIHLLRNSFRIASKRDWVRARTQIAVWARLTPSGPAR
jgi:putative transposase